MKLHKGYEREYRKRHSGIWPELATLLRSAGITEYSIFLDENTGDLFAVMKIKDQEAVDKLAAEPVMKKWWSYMKDLMETNADHSPVVHPLEEVFFLS